MKHSLLTAIALFASFTILEANLSPATTFGMAGIGIRL